MIEQIDVFLVRIISHDPIPLTTPPRAAICLSADDGRPIVAAIVSTSIAKQQIVFLELFFAVLFQMGLHRLFSVSPAVNYVAPSCVSVVCSLLVTSCLVMLGRFPVMACGMRQML
jgi:hypothetical protein